MNAIRQVNGFLRARAGLASSCVTVAVGVGLVAGVGAALIVAGVLFGTWCALLVDTGGDA